MAEGAQVVPAIVVPRFSPETKQAGRGGQMKVYSGQISLAAAGFNIF